MHRSHSRPLLGALLGCAIGASAQGQIVRPIAAQRTTRPEAPSDVMPVTDPALKVGTPVDTGVALTPKEYAGGVLGGIGGGAAGFFLGLAAGAAAAQGCRGDLCALGPAVIGAAAGEAVGLGLGTHLGSGAHGDAALSTLVSTAVMGAGVAVVTAARNGSMLIFVPGVQLMAVISTEQAMARRSR